MNTFQEINGNISSSVSPRWRFKHLRIIHVTLKMEGHLKKVYSSIFKKKYKDCKKKAWYFLDVFFEHLNYIIFFKCAFLLFRDFLIFFFSTWIIIIFMYKVVISVCLFVCPIITHEPVDRFASNFDWGTRENHDNVLSLVEILSWVGTF